MQLFPHIFVFTLGLLIGTQSALAQEAPVEITSTSISGSGCPDGSVSVTLAPGGGALSVLYSNLMGEVAAGDRNIRVNCNVVVHLSKPRDMAFAFTAADFRGFVDLEAGAMAAQRIRLFGGSDGGRPFHLSEQRWQGPVSDEFIISVIPEDSNPSVKCRGRSPHAIIKLNVALIIRANKASQGSGMIVVDSFDGGMLQKYRMKWDRCDGHGGGNGKGKGRGHNKNKARWI